MDHALVALGASSLLAWIYLLLFRGWFWLGRERLEPTPPPRNAWPDVAAIVPARNEADVIAASLGSLLGQRYAGRLTILLVDDHSEDGTAALARRTAEAAGRALVVVAAPPLPPGWTGKLWALAQGLERARSVAPEARYVLFTDADIWHAPDSVARLVAKAEDEGRDLVSLMALLACRGVWERLLIPPFVFFFQKLYPFAWVNDASRRTAAAAGGCVLVRRAALDRAGGLAPMRGALIDDCTLGRRIKTRGGKGGAASIWLGLTQDVRSVRPYAGLPEIWSMVARSAYAQLGHAPLMLVLTVVGMTVLYLAPSLLAVSFPLHGNGLAAALGGLAWLGMSLALVPTLRLYGQPWWLLAPALPLSALLYCAMTLDSALAHHRGRGGVWKGRAQGHAAEALE